MVDALLAAVVTAVAAAVASVLAHFFIPRIWERITSCFNGIWSGLEWCFLKICPCFKSDKNDQKDLEEGLLEGQSSGGLMFSASELEIMHRDNKECWDWPVENPDEPRFKKVAQLRYDTWLEIKARIKVSKLSPNTNYDAYFIFKTTKDSQGLGLIQDAYIYVGKNKYLSSNKVCLKPTFDTPGDKPYLSPKKFSDEWMELNLGQFNSDAVTSYKEVVIKIKEINDFQQKTGLIVAGMELRPIKPKSMGQ